MSNVTLKITFNDDLRRITLPSSTTFEVLQKRLNEMFTSYSADHRLSYIDDEDDRINIQTTEELQEAFRLAHGSVLRLFVQDETNEDSYANDEDSEEDESEQVHAAICDNCDERIVGIRYKCGNCPDFDLCNSCEKLKGAHDANHLFIKIRTPLSPWASPVRVLLPQLYQSAQSQAQQQVPCWYRCMQRAAQNGQHAERRRQFFERLQAQRAAQGSNACPISSEQCGRAADQTSVPRFPFAAFVENLIKQVAAANSEEEKEQSNANTNNTNAEQSAPFKVVVHVRNGDEPKEEQKEVKPELSESEVIIEDVADEKPQQHNSQSEEHQAILVECPCEPEFNEDKPVEPSVEPNVVESVQEEPKRELTRFEVLLRTLEDMGFSDRRKNIEVLVKHAGHLEAAVQELISY